jgi:hypothetical protein
VVENPKKVKQAPIDKTKKKPAKPKIELDDDLTGDFGKY